jgi:hypothetical protein
MPVAAELIEAVVNEKAFYVEEKINQAKNIAADTELGRARWRLSKPPNDEEFRGGARTLTA